MKLQSFLILFLLFLTVNFYSQSLQNKEWSLQQCIEYALKNNLQIKQNDLNAQSSKQNLIQSRAITLPSINGSTSHGYNFGRTIDPFTNQFTEDKVLSQNFSLNGNLDLFNGFQNYNTIKQNQLNYLASKYDVDKMKNDVALNVSTAYLQVLFNNELLNIANNQLEVSNKQVAQTKKLVEVGQVAKGNLYDMLSQEASDELSVSNAQNQLDLSYLSLIQLLNMDSTEGFKILKPEINLPIDPVLSSNPNQIYSMAVTALPEVKSAELKLKSNQSSLAAAKGGISPKLSLNGSLSSFYSSTNKNIIITPEGYTTEAKPFNQQFNDNLNKNIGLRLSIPIFNGLQTQTNISKAKIQQQYADYSLDLAKTQLRKSIQQAYADANAALKKYYATQKAYNAIQEAFKYADQKFNLGAASALDYITAKNKLTKAQADLLQAKYDYVFKAKVLDFYQGKPIDY